MVAFSSAITEREYSGDRKRHRGSWTDGVTGDNTIDTGLRVVTSMKLQQKAVTNAVRADAAVINATFPCDGSAVTIVLPTTTDTENGHWVAEGF